MFGQRIRLKVQAARTEGAGLVQLLHAEYRWRQTRNAHILMEPSCQMCTILRELEVHHIQPWHLAPDLRFDPANLITLCRECHFRFGHYLSWKNYNPGIRELSKFALEMKDEDRNEKLRVQHYYDGFAARCVGAPCCA